MITCCLSKLKEAGLYPKFVSYDQGSTNRSVYSKLNISPQSSFILHNDIKVNFIFDTPHLKIIRNNLMKYDFVVNDRDSAMSLRLVSKLSAKHNYCNTLERMLVSLALMFLVEVLQQA